MKKHERMEEIYESGSIPWDQTDPPPEVIDLAAQLPAGRALDLGCGLGVPPFTWLVWVGRWMGLILSPRQSMGQNSGLIKPAYRNG